MKALVDAAPSAVTRMTVLEMPDESHAIDLGPKAVFDDYRLPNRADWTPAEVDAWYARLGAAPR